jgi:hypothetical protein
VFSSEERALGRNADPPRIAIRAHENLAQDDERWSVIGNSWLRFQAECCAPFRRPARRRAGARRRLGNDESPTRTQERRSTFRGDSGRPEGASNNEVEVRSKCGVPPGVFRPIGDDAHAPDEAELPNRFVEACGPFCSTLKEANA